MIPCAIRDADGNDVPIADGVLTLEEHRRYTLQTTEGAAVHLGARDLGPAGPAGVALPAEFAVGEQRLRLRLDAAEATLRVRILPRAEKLAASAWVTMLSELEGWLGGISTGLEGALTGQVGQEGVDVPWVAEALAPLIPALERALRAALARPVERVRPTWDAAPLHRIRRVTRETLRWVNRHPEVGAWLDPWSAAELSGAPPHLPVREPEDTTDHPANRYLAWLLLRICRRLQATADALRDAAPAQGASLNETAAWVEARAERLERGVALLSDLWRRSFLRRLTPEPISEAALLVVGDHPAYARVHRIGRLLLSPRFQHTQGDQPEARPAATRPSFTLYELWCFLAVQRQLAGRLDDWTWNSTGLENLLKPGGTGAGAAYTATLGDQILELHFNLHFPSFFQRHRSSGALKPRWSISAERRPDLVVTWRRGDAPGRWLALDAKYRVGRSNLGDAFTTLHLYRDALRINDHGGRAAAALLLAPAMTPDTAAWYAAPFREAHGAGVWALTPGDSVGGGLADWVLDTRLPT